LHRIAHGDQIRGNRALLFVGEGFSSVRGVAWTRGMYTAGRVTDQLTFGANCIIPQ
jgi:hypothetical protein